MSAKPWAIAGGGIAGLATAIALAKTGRDVQVFEKTAAFAPIGAGLQLGPNAVRALQSLGIWDAVSPYCATPHEIVIRDGISGSRLQSIDLTQKFANKFGAPYRVILRADLHSALVHSCADFANIKFNMASKWSGNVHDIEALIAADGIWSSLRDEIAPNSKPIFLPHCIHRALVPLPVQADKDAVTLWLYPEGHVVHYVVGNPARLNIVCVTKGSSNAQVWDNKTGSSAIYQHFKNANVELNTTLSLIKNWTIWPATHVPQLSTWTNGNTLLIGDAAHGTAPYLAQGAAMAVEDAALLGALVKKNVSISEMFSKFETIRKPRTWRHHQTALANAKIYHASGALRHARNFTLQLMPQAIFLNRLTWLYQ